MTDFEKQEFWNALGRLYDTTAALRDATAALRHVAASGEKRLGAYEVKTEALLEELKRLHGRQ